MEKICLAIVEDDEFWQKQIEKEILDIWGENIEICFYESGEQFLEKEEAFHVVCMDVELQGMDGFETSAKYKEKYPGTILLILTMHMEFCLEGYFVNAFRYINKMKLKKGLTEAFGKIKEKLYDNRSIIVKKVSAEEKEVFVKDILYIETEKRKVLLHTKEKSFYCSESLKELEEKVKGFGFIRPHRFYLVNMEWIEEIKPSDVILKTGGKLCMSRRRYQECRKRFAIWRLEDIMN